MVGGFDFRTKAEPPVYYSFAKPLEEDAALVEERKEQVTLSFYMELEFAYAITLQYRKISE